MIPRSLLSDEGHPVLLRVKGGPGAFQKRSVPHPLSANVTTQRDLQWRPLQHHAPKTLRLQSNVQKKVFMTFIVIF